MAQAANSRPHTALSWPNAGPSCPPRPAPAQAADGRPRVPTCRGRPWPSIITYAAPRLLAQCSFTCAAATTMPRAISMAIAGIWTFAYNYADHKMQDSESKHVCMCLVAKGCMQCMLHPIYSSISLVLELTITQNYSVLLINQQREYIHNHHQQIK